VLQLKGRKRWFLGDPVPPLPLLYESTAEHNRETKLKNEQCVILEVGQVLYLSRGTPHYADTKDFQEDSLHLTIGVEIETRFTKMEMLRKLLLVLLSIQREENSEENFAMEDLVERVIASMPSKLNHKLRSGLMRWHLVDPAAFAHDINEAIQELQEHWQAVTIAGIVGGPKARLLEEFSVGSHPNIIEQLRRSLLQERLVFLEKRLEHAYCFVLLHEGFQ
jgi:ribosomal protein L16 Arg81 hydroxylase